MHYSVFLCICKKYIINSVVRVVGYLFIIEPINPRKMEHIKTSHIFNVCVYNLFFLLRTEEYEKYIVLGATSH
jgi:hypothetical protein